MADDVEFVWRGLSLGTATVTVTKVTGWLDLPGGSFESLRAAGHGIVPPRVVQGPRVVTVTGTVRGTPSTRDALVASLRSVMVPSAAASTATEPLVGLVAGLTVVAEAKLTNFAVSIDPGVWNVAGWAPWSAQWMCPDPRVFGDWITETAVLVTATGGAALPATLPLTLPAQPIGGRVSIYNPGNDPEGSPAVFTLVGAQSGTVGISLLSTGATLMYGIALGVDDTLVIDTARGGAFLNGAYRAPTAGSSVTGDFRLPPGVSVVQALGSAGAGSPSLTVAVRPASW